MRETWVFTVPSARTSISAISALESPAAARSRISRSRSVSASYSGPGERVGRARKRSQRRRVAPAATTLLPDATARTEARRNSGSADFSRNPLAPASIAEAAASSRSNVVSTRILGASSAYRWTSARVASTPPVPGISRSMSTTSGAVAATCSTRLGAVARLAHDLEVGLRAEHHRDAGPEHRLVVDQQHADGHEGRPGIVTSVTQRPELSPARTRPPSCATRSVIPSRP